MIQLAWIGVGTADPRWRQAEDWLANNWTSWRDRNNVYAYYAFAKAMRLAEPPVIEFSATGLDWYGDEAGLARFIVDRQNTNGSWPSSNIGCNINIGVGFATAWQIVILTQTLFCEPPVAAAGEDIIWGCEIPLEFNGCESLHLCEGRVLVWHEWDFDGDGVYDYGAEDCSVEYTYEECPAAGELFTYNAVLRVTDDAGETATDTREVAIAPPPHAPFAVIGDLGTVWAEIPFVLVSSDSFDIDPGDYITRVEWDLDNDGVFDFDNPDEATDCPPPPAECPELTWVYAQPGTYIIGLRVWDSGVLNPAGCTPGEDCVKWPSEPDFAEIVVQAPEALPPIADAGGPYSGDECEPIPLDGSGSEDPDGDEIFFSWDLDGDGECDDATGPFPVYQWTSDGPDFTEYTIRLCVTDLVFDDTDESTITVSDLEPSASLSGPTELEVGQAACFVATMVSACDAIVSIDWDWQYIENAGFDPSGESGAEQCHTYAIQGSYTIAVRAEDEDGDAVIATLGIVVSSEEPDCSDDDGDGKVTICHRPPGNPNNAHTISVSVNAVPAHLGHGDICGPCQ